MELPQIKRRHLTTPTTLVPLLETLPMMSPTGQVQKDTSAPLMLSMPPPNVLRMLKENGVSSSTMFTTTLRLPVLKPAYSLKLLAVLLLHATKVTVPRSLSTTDSSPATHTRVSSSTSTSFPQLALATSPPKIVSVQAVSLFKTELLLLLTPEKPTPPIPSNQQW